MTIPTAVPLELPSVEQGKLYVQDGLSALTQTYSYKYNYSAWVRSIHNYDDRDGSDNEPGYIDDEFRTRKISKPDYSRAQQAAEKLGAISVLTDSQHHKKAFALASAVLEAEVLQHRTIVTAPWVSFLLSRSYRQDLRRQKALLGEIAQTPQGPAYRNICGNRYWSGLNYAQALKEVLAPALD